jgi:hypothetical protein
MGEVTVGDVGEGSGESEQGETMVVLEEVRVMMTGARDCMRK